MVTTIDNSQNSYPDENTHKLEDDTKNLPVFFDFKTASQEVLKFLQKRIGFDLWMLTRAEGNDWIVLQAEDTGYGIKAPTVLNWVDSFCIHMVQGEGPQVAPSSNSIPAYASARIGEQLTIGAYIGVPIISNDGSLFGTLCAIHPEPLPEAIQDELPLVRLLSQLLSSLLREEQELNKQKRLTERAETEALNNPETGCYDPLTELYNSNGWWQLLMAEEHRCEIYGSPAWVFSIEVNENLTEESSETLKQDNCYPLKVSRVLFEATHPEDIIAQIGINKYAILAIESNAGDANALLNRLNTISKKFGIDFFVGHSARHPEEGLRSAWQKSEEALVRVKKSNLSNNI